MSPTPQRWMRVPSWIRSRREARQPTGASLGETCRKWKLLPVVVADRNGVRRRLLLQPQHRLDVELAHDVHVGPRVVPPRGRQLVPEPGAGGAFPFPVPEEAVVDHRSGYVGSGRPVL